MLEEEESAIQPIYDVAKQFAPDYDLDSILNILLDKDGDKTALSDTH